MSDFITDPSKISFEEYLNELEAYIEAKPDSAKWFGFFGTSAGQTVLELIAGHGTFLAYQTLMARRESFIRYVQDKSSAIGHAQNKGYSVFRGENAKILVTLTPTNTESFNKFTSIGLVGDFSLILLEDINLVAGQQISFTCTRGELGEEEITVNSDAPQVFRFQNPNVSEDIIVYVNNVSVSTSKRLIDAEAGKFVIQTNPYTSVDVFYLNNPATINTSDIIKIRYVVINNENFQLSDVSLSISGTYSVETEQVFQEFEETESIKVNAPLYAETQFVIRGREDYIKLFKLLNSTIIDSNYRNYSPMTVDIYYLRDNLSFFTQAEEADLIVEMGLYRSQGLDLPRIKKSVRNQVQLKININASATSTTLISDINNVVKSYEKILGNELNFINMEDEIENISVVKTARLEVLAPLRQNLASYGIGSYVSISGQPDLVFRAEKILYFSDSVEPVWPTTLGDLITDGRVIWKCKYLERQCDPLNPQTPLVPPRPIWQANTDYQIGAIVIPTVLGIFEYEMVGSVNKSGGSEPSWPALDGGQPKDIEGNTVKDKNILWMALPQVGNPAAWAGDNEYELGNIIIANDQTATDTVGVMFQAVAFLGVTTTPQPSFQTMLNGETVDGDIFWRRFVKTDTPVKLTNDNYYLLTTSINISVV
jgi:hypothetical protein